MEKDRIGLLLIINRLLTQETPLGKDEILRVAQIKLPFVADNYDELVRSLLDEKLISGNPDHFALTPQGEAQLIEATRENDLVSMFYDEYYQAVQNSKTHSLFCERVYGLDLAQHGIADMEQLEIMLGDLQLEPGMRVLDFGCGDGRISEYIAERTKTKVCGVDKSKIAIELANQRTSSKRDYLEFIWADIEKEEGEFPSGPFDRIIAIDSLMFVRDTDKVLNTLFSNLNDNGRMGIFLISHPDVDPNDHPVGLSLFKLGGYSIRDLSDLNKKHWSLKKQVLLELEDEFLNEGSQFLFKNRIAECSGLDEFNRYLYRIIRILR